MRVMKDDARTGGRRKDTGKGREREDKRVVASPPHQSVRTPQTSSRQSVRAQTARWKDIVAVFVVQWTLLLVFTFPTAHPTTTIIY
ncbi:hypothetical protein Pcinc_018484 [Petrolisthes cinctipes]|uniref:Uncharacterized protein n=1 Tax=Petrolisthes cinctipes TaxID=88211 RepID=A0AAE1FM42_PETCI|nr:hypothetical protein Pcinc_018484 [Petrolisthes cinctipes]